MKVPSHVKPLAKYIVPQEISGVKRAFGNSDAHIHVVR